MAIHTTKQFPMIILMTNMFIAMSGIGLIIPIMPTLLHHFGVGGQVNGLLIATFAFAQFIFSPFAGGLSDRIGRKKTMVTGIFLFMASQLLFAYSHTLSLLFISRLLGGMGAAFMIPSIMAYVADISPKKELAKGMGRIGAATSLGFVIGPGIGGFLAEFGIRVPVLIAAVVAGLCGIFSYFFLPESKETVQATEQKRENLAKQLWSSVKKPYFILLVMVFTFSFGLANFQSSISLFADIKFSFTPKDISVVMVVSGIAGAIIQAFLLAKVLNRFGEVPVVNMTLTFSAISLFALLFAHGFWSILFIATVFVSATSLLRPAINTLVSKMAGDEQGFAAGMNNAYMSIGNMVGPAIAGALFDINMGFPFITGSILFILCLTIHLTWMSIQSRRSVV